MKNKKLKTWGVVCLLAILLLNGCASMTSFDDVCIENGYVAKFSIVNSCVDFRNDGYKIICLTMNNTYEIIEDECGE